MTQRERQGWIIVASLFVTLVFVFGSGYNTGGLFFPHLLKHFGWKRAQLSTLQGAALPLSAGLSAPLIGWLLDRVEARIVMVAGAIMTGVSFLIASRVDSFGPLFGAYVLLGVGIGASTLLPCCAGDRELVRRAPWACDGLDVRRHLARRRRDDDGRQCRDRARRMARGIRRARDPDVRHCSPAGNLRGQDAAAAGRGHDRRAGQRRVAGIRIARGVPLPLILDDLRGAVLLRRYSGRRGVASDHLSHRTRLHGVIRSRHDEPGVRVRRVRQARDGPAG